jgi:5-methylcytosine-specific restriction endonuclease McrA
VLDGQQRITSFGRFVTGKFAIVDDNGMQQYFSGLAKDKQDRIMNSELLVYECEGTETEIKEWFRTINIAGVPLNDQELLNAVYSGKFVTLGKEEFSNSQNANVQKWSAYVSGSVNRQDFWERALEWVSGGKENIGAYMSSHRNDTNINEVRTHFNSVIEWASSVFIDVEREMRGLEWGRLYETYHDRPYDPQKLSAQLKELYGDPYVKSRKGIWEYLLGGSEDPRLLDVRVFDDAVKKSTYARQTKQAEESGVSNCPLCALGANANKTKIWALTEMDADHVAAWSEGGVTSAENCEMLCVTHNRAKGNR